MRELEKELYAVSPRMPRRQFLEDLFAAVAMVVGVKSFSGCVGRDDSGSFRHISF